MSDNHGGLYQIINNLQKQLLEAYSQAEQLRGQAEKFRQSEKLMSESYLRIRGFVDAFDTPHAPSDEQVYDLTESKLARLVGKSSLRDSQIKIYMQAINKIEDYFEYSNESSRDKIAVMSHIDSLAQQLRDNANKSDGE